ncbi:MAG: hypothetical protein QG599_1005 [Pseudomonadota bacterium]|nr:hypothetical protein [Pseudomonadota bacterium]
MTIEILSNLLARLGESLNMGPLQLNADGALGLEIDHRLTLGMQFDSDRDRLLIYADIGPLPQGTEKESLMNRMLQANLFGRLTAGATLALASDIDPEEQPQRVVLWKAIDGAALELSYLEQTLQNMISAVEDWQDALQEWNADTPANPEMTDFAFNMPGIRV